MAKSKLLRMDNIGIVVESLDDAISFFTELGLTLEGRTMVEGEWAARDHRERVRGAQRESSRNPSVRFSFEPPRASRC